MLIFNCLSAFLLHLSFVATCSTLATQREVNYLQGDIALGGNGLLKNRVSVDACGFIRKVGPRDSSRNG